MIFFFFFFFDKWNYHYYFNNVREEEGGGSGLLLKRWVMVVEVVNPRFRRAERSEQRQMVFWGRLQSRVPSQAGTGSCVRRRRRRNLNHATVRPSVVEQCVDCLDHRTTERALGSL
jgi:hypothetical protein